MGRMKEELMKREEADWVAEEQAKWLNDVFRWKGVVYGDIIDVELISDEKFARMHIELIDGESCTYNKEDIEEFNGLCIKFRKDIPYLNMKRVIVIPLDKIVKITYEYDM